MNAVEMTSVRALVYRSGKKAEGGMSDSRAPQAL